MDQPLWFQGSPLAGVVVAQVGVLLWKGVASGEKRRIDYCIRYYYELGKNSLSLSFFHSLGSLKSQISRCAGRFLQAQLEPPLGWFVSKEEASKREREEKKERDTK